jgi:hypothetical protein
VVAEFLFSIGPDRDPAAVAEGHVLWEAMARIDNLVDLRPEAHQRAIGLPVPFDETGPRDLCQQIGAAAYYVRYKGILAPSAARSGAINLVVFPDYLEAGDSLEPSEGDWPRSLAYFLTT